MKKNSKMLAMLMAGAMTILLAGCSSDKTAAKTEATEAAKTTASSEQASEKATEAETEAATADKTFKIGVIQLVQHAALDAANEGFFAALDEAGVKYEADQKNASGEQANCLTIAEKLVNDKDDLILV